MAAPPVRKVLGFRHVSSEKVKIRKNLPKETQEFWRNLPLDKKNQKSLSLLIDREPATWFVKGPPTSSFWKGLFKLVENYKQSDKDKVRHVCLQIFDFPDQMKRPTFSRSLRRKMRLFVQPEGQKKEDNQKSSSSSSSSSSSGDSSSSSSSSSSSGSSSDTDSDGKDEEDGKEEPPAVPVQQEHQENMDEKRDVEKEKFDRKQAKKKEIEDEVKKQEEAQKKQEETQKKQEEAQKKQEEAQKKQEETQKKQGEAQKKQEEAQKKQEKIAVASIVADPVAYVTYIDLETSKEIKMPTKSTPKMGRIPKLDGFLEAQAAAAGPTAAAAGPTAADAVFKAPPSVSTPPPRSLASTHSSPHGNIWEGLQEKQEQRVFRLVLTIFSFDLLHVLSYERQ